MCFGAILLSAQTKPISKPELDKKLDSLFKEFNNTSSTGYAITVIQNGKAITTKDYGLANLEFKVPFNHNTVVTIPYSEGREFISIAAAFWVNFYFDATGMPTHFDVRHGRLMHHRFDKVSE